MNREPFDEHLSWELRSLVENADPPPTLRPATGARVRHLPRPVIPIGSVAAAVLAIAALLTTAGSSGPSRQHVASEGSGGRATTTTEEGVVVPVTGLPGVTQTTIANRSTPTTVPKKGGSTPTTVHDDIVARPAPQLSVTAYDMHGTGPWGVTAGPDGNLWSAAWPNDVVRITPSGAVTPFPVPATGDQTGSGCPTGITVGPDKNLWFTTRGCASIGRITTDGKITLFDVPLYSGGPITVGGDGALWFSTSGAPNKGAIGRLTTSGTFTKFDTPCCYGMTTGSDGNVWFGSGSHANTIGRITPAGTVTEFPVQHGPSALALGPDGNVWFFGYGSVGRITPAGQVQEYEALIGGGQPFAITRGPDGNVWFMGTVKDGSSPVIGRVTLAGKVTMYPSPLPPQPGTGASNLAGITAGADGNLWFTETEGRMGKFPPPAN